MAVNCACFHYIVSPTSVRLSDCQTVTLNDVEPHFPSGFFLQVCAEETMNEILKRYLPYNSHAASYTWKYFGNNLDMTKTLEANGVTDEGEDFFELRMDEDEFLPPISLYFNDDLTEA